MHQKLCRETMIKAFWGGSGKGIRKVYDHSLGVTSLLKMAEALANLVLSFLYC